MLEPQSFAKYERKGLQAQGGSLSLVQKRSINEIVAANLKYLAEQPGYPYASDAALAREAKVAHNTIINYRAPKRRTVAEGKAEGEGYPTLDKLVKIAAALKCEPWELLHPNLAGIRASKDEALDMERVRKALTLLEKYERTDSYIRGIVDSALNAKSKRDRAKRKDEK
jgi:transcriptional regulator with XRE-family HTH domain